jgi:hypothetical protein
VLEIVEQLSLKDGRENKRYPLDMPLGQENDVKAKTFVDRTYYA